jgi:hypothetical protein
MQPLRSVLPAVLMALALVTTAPASDSKLPPEVRSALDQASSLRVELAADLLFGLIDSGKVPKDTSVSIWIAYFTGRPRRNVVSR